MQDSRRPGAQEMGQRAMQRARKNRKKFRLRWKKLRRGKETYRLERDPAGIVLTRLAEQSLRESEKPRRVGPSLAEHQPASHGGA